jgi:SAM-dependent methyltransferase
MKNSSSVEIYGGLCAEFYDLDKPYAPEDEMSFYLQYAQQIKGHILEPMCGTGSFLIPLVEAGFDIEGFDASPFMLEFMRQKCVAKNITCTTWQGRWEDLSTHKRYGLIFIPSSSFCLVTGYEAICHYLKTIWTHLADDGLFVFDAIMFNAVPVDMGVWKGEVKHKSDGSYIISSSLGVSVQDNILSALNRYDLVDKNKIIRTEMETYRLQLYKPEELTTLLKTVGFSHVKMVKAFVHGQSPGEQDDVIVYECKK